MASAARRMAVGIDVVGGLRHVDVVVGVDRRVRSARPRRGVSLARLASTSLTFMLWEVPAPAWYTSTMNWSCQRPSDDLPRRRHDGVADGRAQPAERHVRLSGGQLHLGRGDDQRRVGPQPADREILHRARRLNAVVGIRWNRPFSQRIPLRSRLHGRLRLPPPQMQKGGNLAQVSPLDFTRRFRPPAYWIGCTLTGSPHQAQVCDGRHWSALDTSTSRFVVDSGVPRFTE